MWCRCCSAGAFDSGTVRRLQGFKDVLFGLSYPSIAFGWEPPSEYRMTAPNSLGWRTGSDFNMPASTETHSACGFNCTAMR